MRGARHVVVIGTSGPVVFKIANDLESGGAGKPAPPFNDSSDSAWCNWLDTSLSACLTHVALPVVVAEDLNHTVIDMLAKKEHPGAFVYDQYGISFVNAVAKTNETIKAHSDSRGHGQPSVF